MMKSILPFLALLLTSGVVDAQKFDIAKDDIEKTLKYINDQLVCCHPEKDEYGKIVIQADGSILLPLSSREDEHPNIYALPEAPKASDAVDILESENGIMLIDSKQGENSFEVSFAGIKNKLAKRVAISGFKNRATAERIYNAFQHLHRLHRRKIDQIASLYINLDVRDTLMARINQKLADQELVAKLHFNFDGQEEAVGDMQYDLSKDSRGLLSNWNASNVPVSDGQYSDLDAILNECRGFYNSRAKLRERDKFLMASFTSAHIDLTYRMQAGYTNFNYTWRYSRIDSTSRLSFEVVATEEEVSILKVVFDKQFQQATLGGSGKPYEEKAIKEIVFFVPTRSLDTFKIKLMSYVAGK